MPTAVPQSLQNALGPEASRDLARFVSDTARENAVPRKPAPAKAGEYREVLSRLDVVESRIDGLDHRLDGLDHRMDRFEDELRDLRREMNERFDQMNAQSNERFDRMNERFDQMNAQFNERFDRMHEQMRVMMRWTVGTIALFGAIFAILMAIATFG